MLVMRERLNRALRELNKITDPCSQARGFDLGLVSMGMIATDQIKIDGNQISIKILLTSPSCEMSHYFTREINRSMRHIGFEEVEIKYDYGLEWTPERMTDEARDKMIRNYH